MYCKSTFGRDADLNHDSDIPGCIGMNNSIYFNFFQGMDIAFLAFPAFSDQICIIFQRNVFEWFTCMLLCQHTLNYNETVFWFMIIIPLINKQNFFRYFLYHRHFHFQEPPLFYIIEPQSPQNVANYPLHYSNVSIPNLYHLSNKPCSVQSSDMDRHESMKSCQMPVSNDRHLTTVF